MNIIEDVKLSEVIYYPGAHYLKCGILRTEKGEQVGGGIRGKVKDFSKKSRWRLMKYLGMIDCSKVPVFVSLTFPANFPDIRDSKRIMKNFIKRMIRAWGDLGGIIKIEPQLRGAAHFHLLVWGVGNRFDEYLTWVAVNWHDLAGQGDPNHFALLLGQLPGSKPCVEKIRSWNGVMWYTGKYLAKTIEAFGDQHPGRFWWTFNKSKIPYAKEKHILIDRKRGFEIIRYMRRFARLKGRKMSSLTILCSADRWINSLSLDT